VIERPEFQVKPQSPRSALLDWLVDVLDRILAPLFRYFGGLWAMSPPLAIGVIVVLTLLLVALLLHIVYTFRQVLDRRAKALQLSDSTLAAIDPRTLELNAEEAAHRHDYIDAVRLVFRASLLRLEQRDRRGVRPGITNHEYLRRYRDTPTHELLGQFVEIIDAKWYGGRACDCRDYALCQRAHEQLRAEVGA
jgi:hypothetical protein